MSNVNWLERGDPTSDFDAATLLRAVTGDLSEEVEFGAVLEGSIPEGLGNRTSDVDFLIVVPDEYTSSEVPLITFVQGYRIEVRRRSVRDLENDAALVNGLSLSDRRRLTSFSYEKLDTYQRFMDGQIVKRSRVLDSAREPYIRQRFAEVLQAWHVARMRMALRRAVALHELGDGDAARGWIRAAAISAGKFWVASRGQMYLADKWLGEQQSRVGLSNEIRSTFWQFAESDVYRGSFADALGKIAALAEIFGCSLETSEYARPLLAHNPNVTTWRIGESTLVLKNRSDLYLLDEHCAASWSRVVHGRPLSEHVDDPNDRESLRAISRAGLLTLGWEDGEVWERNGAPPVLELASTPLSQHGLCAARQMRPPVALVPLGAVRTIFAGCELVWANVAVENGWEDLYGAREAEQWQAVASATRRTLAWACQIAFSGAGVNPPPDRQEIVSRLSELPEFPAHLVLTASRLQSIEIWNYDDATACLTGLQEFVQELRELYNIKSFPGSFENSDKWKATLELILDWARLASYLDDPLSAGNRTFPIGEVRDMLGISGQ